MEPDRASEIRRKKAAGIRAEFELTKEQYQEALNVWVEHYPRVADRFIGVQNRRLETARRHRDYDLAVLSGGRRSTELEQELSEANKQEAWDLFTILAEVKPDFSATSAHAEYCAAIDAANAEIKRLYEVTRTEMIDYYLDTRGEGPTLPEVPGSNS